MFREGIEVFTVAVGETAAITTFLEEASTMTEPVNSKPTSSTATLNERT